MQFDSYQAFRVAVGNLIEGDDIGETFDTSTLDLIIGLAEERVYVGDDETAGLRSSTMEAPLSVVLSNNTADLPADLLELKEVYFAGKSPLEIVPLDRLRRLSADGYGGGEAKYCAQDGDSLVFWPEASGTVIGSYYAKPEALADVDPWSDATTFARYPQLFVFASLIEAMPFLGMESRTANWDARYRMALKGAQHNERMRVYGGGRLRVRTS
jgi:hypothetical protein